MVQFLVLVVQFVKEDGEGVLQIRVEMVRCRSAFMLQWRFCRFAFLSPHTRGSSQKMAALLQLRWRCELLRAREKTKGITSTGWMCSLLLRGGVRCCCGIRCTAAGEVMKIEDGGCHGEVDGGAAAAAAPLLMVVNEG